MTNETKIVMRPVHTVAEVLLSCTCCMYPSPMVGKEGGCDCCPCELHDEEKEEE